MCVCVWLGSGWQTSWGRPVADKAFRQGKHCLYVKTDAYWTDHSIHLIAQVERTWTMVSASVCAWETRRQRDGRGKKMSTSGLIFSVFLPVEHAVVTKHPKSTDVCFTLLFLQNHRDTASLNLMMSPSPSLSLFLISVVMIKLTEKQKPKVSWRLVMKAARTDNTETVSLDTIKTEDTILVPPLYASFVSYAFWLAQMLFFVFHNDTYAWLSCNFRLSPELQKTQYNPQIVLNMTMCHPQRHRAACFKRAAEGKCVWSVVLFQCVQNVKSWTQIICNYTYKSANSSQALVIICFLDKGCHSERTAIKCAW